MKAKLSLTQQSAEVELAKDDYDFLEKLMPKSAKDLGGILGDRVAQWRFNNQLKIIQDAKEKIAESGLNIKEIPLKTLFPIIENSALEEDEVLQEKWASLLANAAAGKYVRPSYAELLKELSSVEAKILDDVFRVINSPQYDGLPLNEIVVSAERVSELYGITKKDTELVVDNFYRLNICQPPYSNAATLSKWPMATVTREDFVLTPLGFDFIEMCKWNTA